MAVTVEASRLLPGLLKASCSGCGDAALFAIDREAIAWSELHDAGCSQLSLLDLLEADEAAAS